jgi:aquaporin NIP
MNKYLAEAIGTFALVFCGTGAIVINQETAGVITHSGIAITFGLIVATMIYTFGDISGAHLNPAVSIAFWVAKVFPFQALIPYILSQAAGAFMASLTLHYLFPANTTLGSTLPLGSSLQSFILEFILSFILMLVIMRVAKGGKEQGLFAGIAIGSVVLLEAMFAGPICGASMNPIRSIAPALVSGNTQSLWVYIFGPLIGAIAAVYAFNGLKKTPMPDQS